MINNLAGASFAMVTGGSAIVAGDGSAVAFNNAGTFTCSTSGSTSMSPSTTPARSSVQQGGLDLGGTAARSARLVHRRRGPTLDLSGQDLTTSSVISSDGFVALNGCTEAGSYSATGDTNASNTSFTGTVRWALRWRSTAPSASPAAGGPVTLTTGTLTVDGRHPGRDRQLRGQRAADAQCLTAPSASRRVDAYGGMAIDRRERWITLSGTTLNNYGAATWDLAR